MTGSELKELNTQIRAGRELDDATFWTLVNLAKTTFEMRRPWRKLVKKDTSKTAGPATTYATAIDLPADFLMTIPRKTVKLVDSSGGVLEYTEKKFEDWELFKFSAGYFTIDHGTNHLYLSGSGNLSQTYTIYLPYVGTSATIAAGTSWVFPDQFHPALAFEVAAMDELGIDYDDINARMGNANAARAELIMRAAGKWDDTLQRSAVGA